MVNFASDFKAVGPLAGFLSGQADAINRDDAEQEILRKKATTDLLQQQAEGVRIENPLRAAEAAVKIAKAEQDLPYYQSPDYAADEADKRKSEKLDRLAKMDENQQKMVLRQAEMQFRAHQSLGEDYNPDDQNPASLAKWVAATEPIRQSGGKIPPVPSREAYEKLRANAELAKNSLQWFQDRQKFQDQKELEDLKHEHQMTKTEFERASIEGEGAANRASNERMKEIAANARAQAASSIGLNPKTFQHAAVIAINKIGKERITPADVLVVKQYEAYLRTQAAGTAAKDPVSAMNALKSGQALTAEQAAAAADQMASAAKTMEDYMSMNTPRPGELTPPSSVAPTNTEKSKINNRAQYWLDKEKPK